MTLATVQDTAPAAKYSLPDENGDRSGYVLSLLSLPMRQKD
jgi:hypothetical protein